MYILIFIIAISDKLYEIFTIHIIIHRNKVLNIFNYFRNAFLRYVIIV